MAETTYDVVIIGSGPGGYVAAVRAGQLGLKTAIVEREALGGICLNWGCIPTKALLRSAEIYQTLQRLDEFGLKAENIGYDAQAIVKRSRKVATQLSNGVRFLMKKNKVDVIEGTGKLAGAGRVSIDGKDGRRELQAKDIILATGARARTLPGMMVVSAVTAIASSYVGLIASFHLELASGPTIILTAAILDGLSIIVAPMGIARRFFPRPHLKA